jgi:hypothetical protein
MITPKYSINKASYARKLAKLKGDVMDKTEVAFRLVATETITFLRSYTRETRPPARGGTRRRPAHPGHWADITHLLANSYGFVLTRTVDRVRLQYYNTAPYAAHLENSEAFWVLRGVTDPGGPMEIALARVVDTIGAVSVKV